MSPYPREGSKPDEGTTGAVIPAVAPGSVLCSELQVVVSGKSWGGAEGTSTPKSSGGALGIASHSSNGGADGPNDGSTAALSKLTLMAKSCE